jgi:pyridoxal phosphate enzyme (YggS family)
MPVQALNLQQQYFSIMQQIDEAATIAGRDRETIKLLAVSKTQSVEQIRSVYALGQRAFGENYVQEAKEKQQGLYDLDIEWHFIGPLQSNKTREVAEHFSWVHSVDRFKIAQRLSRQRPKDLPSLNICLQINVDNEESKSGIDIESLPSLVSEVMELPRLQLRGLMAIPAAKDNYEDQLQSFQYLAKLMSDYPRMDTLSMGMSNDMKAAIVAGSTIVRVGAGIFGKRKVQ